MLFSNTRNPDSWEKWLGPGLGQRTHGMTLAYHVVPAVKGPLRKVEGVVKGTHEPI